MSDTESAAAGDVPLDLAGTDEVVARLINGQRRAIEAVVAGAAALSGAVTAAAERLGAGAGAGEGAGAGAGRLVLVGAGASGRLCVQDGAELWPTFGWPAERLLLVMAGGEAALLHSVEGVEDDAAQAIEAVRAHGIGPDDVVLAVAASGRSPWTVGWLREARERGALSIGMASNPDTPLLQAAEHPVLLHTGAEVLAGSTRLGAGTAQKAALNTFSTALMVRLNRTHDGLMVDMAAVNAKLDRRRLAMLRQLVPDADEAAASAALVEADGWVKLAVLVLAGDSVEVGRRRLDACHGSLRAALAMPRDEQ